MNKFYILFLILLLFNYFLFNLNNFISNKLKLFDYPDNKRKFHKKKTPLTGGIFIFINIIIIFVLSKFDHFEYISTIFQNKREFVSSSFLISSLFIIGLYDDKYDLNPFKKLFLSAFFILLGLLIDESLIIRELNFYTYNYSIKLMGLSIPFTILSFLLFINSLNMFDGIDLQVPLYILIIFLYLVLSKNNHLIVFILPVMIFIIYLNYKQKLFLGDSGTNLLASLISIILIKQYNSGNQIIYCDEIFLLMLIPGIDMLRLFFTRILKGKNPFSSDNQHLHHLYLNKYSQTTTIIFIQMHIFIPILIFKFSNGLLLVILFVSMVIYVFSLFLLKLNNN